MARSSQRQYTSTRHLLALAMGALGIVYGDIGTSPLYALRECFYGAHAVEPNATNVYGVLSLIIWSLILTITVKYMLYVLQADNRGEGGIMALTALACPRRKRTERSVLLFIGLFGAALLYGDGAITPAISVLSAVEGLEIATPAFAPFVLPITIVVLVFLFLFQRVGTARIGLIFGPIILVWFTTLGLLGLAKILENPEVLLAVNPKYALDFFVQNQWHGFIVLGAVFLSVTGGEALYADMGHFGKRPIQIAWFTVALPGLLLNYFGQAATLLADPTAAVNPFYRMAPGWMLYPLVALATLATVIASQAVISGVYSLTRQAIQLGYAPRLQIVHTSQEEIGQIYMPQVNWGLLVATIWLVLEFRSSSNLAAAYGIAVSTTMVITTLLMYTVTRRLWRWPFALSVFVCGVFLMFDIAFFVANSLKITQGGWFPLALGGVTFMAMATWQKGRQILGERLRSRSIPLQSFMAKLKDDGVARVPGIAMFMYGDPHGTPPALVHNLKHNKVVHNDLLILTVVTEEVPFVAKKERVQVHKVMDKFYRLVAHYGFMESPNIREIIELARLQGLEYELKDITFFLGRETLIASDRPGMAIWREKVFAFMSNNAQRATAFFQIPPDQVIEVGMQVEI